MPIKLTTDMRTTENRSANEIPFTAWIRTLLLIFVIVLMLPVSAMAYVGPGAGITLLGALWAVIVAILLMVGGLLTWPIRAFLRRRRNARQKETP